MKRYKPLLYRLCLLYFLILTIFLAVEFFFSLGLSWIISLGNVMLALMILPGIGILTTGRRNPWLRLCTALGVVVLWTILMFFYSCTPLGASTLPLQLCQSNLFNMLYPAVLYLGAAAGALIPIAVAFLIFRLLFPKKLPKPIGMPPAVRPRQSDPVSDARVLS